MNRSRKVSKLLYKNTLSCRHIPLMILTMMAMSPLSLMTMAMVDVNPQELQYISDHLTDHKCSQLIDALHQRTFQLHENHDGKNDTRQEEPCMPRLEAWSKGPGKNLTVEYISVRLSEIGLPKLSKKISGLVMKETSEELHRFFLDDPFKAMIPTKSAMVDEGEEKEDESKVLDEDKKGKEDTEDHLFASVVVLATVCVTLFAAMSVCLLCPKAGRFVCQNACPRLCSSCYDVMVEGCHRVWYGTRKNINKYMLVTPKSAGGGGTLLV